MLRRLAICVRDQTPPKPIKRSLACLRILADDPVLLAGGSIVARRHVQGFDKARDLKPELVRRRFLSEASAHYLTFANLHRHIDLI